AAAESKITVDAVLNIFDSEFRYKPIIDMWDPRGREHFGRKLAFFIERNLALPFMLPGFPCKSPNAADKVLGHLPDKGEELALASMVTIGDLIREVYAPGAKFVIVSDGHVFSDLIGVPDANVNEYGATLRSQVVQSTGRPELFSFFDLRDMTFPDSNAPDRSVMESASRIESELPSQYAVSVEHHLQADTNPIADETRRLLCVLAGSSRSILRKDIASDHVTTALYRAFSRFLLDDLRHMPEMQALPSKSAQKKLCTKIAFEMMIRNQAYSALVELLFPLHLRISVHGHSCEGPKFGVRLIHRSFLAKDAFIPAFEGSTSLHIPTPWHNVVV
ncbi:Pyoverdine/dityrosine biosynthesis protein-domain-containing protein, partial [Fimicolochytrium jonesii]|uniref:Pyoverdine/dityrosine biosynthesis protein-domain-containing protein n=1 Tax=Fimicolochytrium jonesii TaxID=1396493 RepID=UPI0022FE866C